MESEISGADLFPIIKEAAQNTQIIYTILADEQGYGISVQSTGDDASGVRIEGLTSDPRTAQRILLLLADNLVYPYNVYEILDDLLAIDPFV